MLSKMSLKRIAKVLIALGGLFLVCRILYVSLYPDYWTGIYYPAGSLTGNAIYSPKFGTKEECIGWSLNERGLHPEDNNVPLGALWKCNKNCELYPEYKYLIHHGQRGLLEENSGPLYVCEEGFDGGDWIGGSF
jgi:hypothetical protein